MIKSAVYQPVAKQGQLFLQHLPQKQQQQHQQHPVMRGRMTSKTATPTSARKVRGALHRWMSVHAWSMLETVSAMLYLYKALAGANIVQ